MAATPPTAPSLGLAAIDQISLSCTDLDEAQRFYCGVLGLRLAGDAAPILKLFDCAGVNIIMTRSDSISPGSAIYFRIPGTPGLLQEKTAALRAAGVPVTSEPHVIAQNWQGHDVWIALFEDPFGNTLGLKSDVPVSAAPATS